MAYRIQPAAHTLLAGSTKGTFLEDLTSPGIGQWPKTQAIKKISKTVVYAGSITDSVRITYEVENAPTPITVHHGGPGGIHASKHLFIPGITLITADEKLVAVYGNRLANTSQWGERSIVQLSLVVAYSSGKTQTAKVYTASGYYDSPTVKFELSFPLMAVSSYTFEPAGMGMADLQAIGFSNVLYKASPPTL